MKRTAGEHRVMLISWPHILVVLGLVVSLSVILDFNRRLAGTQRIVADSQQLSTEVAGSQAEHAALQAELAYASSDQYVEAWARDDGKQVKPGEVLVVPVAPAAPTAAPASTPAPGTAPPAQETSTWSLWWTLFFGS